MNEVEAFTCPISRQIMSDPVVLADGHTYEAKAIQIWLKTKQRSPVTNEILKSKECFPNHSLKTLILAFKHKHGQALLKFCKEATLGTNFEKRIVEMMDDSPDVNVRDAHGNTALMVLLERGKITKEIMSSLIENGAKLAFTNDKSLNACDIAIRSRLGDEIINALNDALEQEYRSIRQMEQRRKQEQDAFRQQQEERTQELQNSSSDDNNFGLGFSSPNTRNGYSMGFFPSLFGLQFQNLSSSSAVGPNNSGNSTHRRLFGLPLHEEDTQHHEFLSQTLFILGGSILFTVFFLL